MPLEHRIAFYNQIRQTKAALKESLFAQLGNKCARCSDTENLRLRFKDRANPLARRYATNPMVLHRRLLREPELREQVQLLCRACRFNQPGYKPLESTMNRGLLD